MPSRFVRMFLGVALVLVPSVLQAADEAPGFDPRFRDGARSDVLVAGPPRLLRGHLDDFVDLFESAFDLALPQASERALREALETEFRGGTSAQREALLELVDPIGVMRSRARCCDWSFVHAGLRRFRTAIDRRLRETPEAPASAAMLAVLQRRHQVVWRGAPALKSLAVEAYLEMVLFAASLGRNEAVRLSAGQLRALRTFLGRDLRRCCYATRDGLVQAHRTWLGVKARWDRSRERRRLALRWQAVHMLARLAPVCGGVPVASGGDYKAYTRAASKVAEADRAVQAVTALARHPKALLDAFRCGLGLRSQAAPFPFLYR